LVPANHHRTFDLLHTGWCYQFTLFRVLQIRELYHLLEFPVVFALTDRGHKASSKEAFILTITQQVTAMLLWQIFLDFLGMGWYP